MIFHVIGIGNKPPLFSKEQQALIQKTRVFSGGKRHLNLVKAYLPKGYQWIVIQSPMAEVFKAYETKNETIIVFASGNPLFYGFSNTLRNRYPLATIYTAPYFSAIQLLANKTNTNSNALVTVSVHGRPWNALDVALIHQKPLVGVLTDKIKTPKAIAERLLKFGYTNYTMSIGEDIEGDNETIQQLSLSEVLNKNYHELNCILLHRKTQRPRHFGIKDRSFIGLEGRPNMITKMPIRLTSLHLLDVLNATVFWDIGFCTGSISIEAKLKHPELEVVAFEKRQECKAILEQNQQAFGVPGITAVMGDFFEQELHTYPKPDCVFIGGHGGQLNTLMRVLDRMLDSNAKVVINTVKATSRETFKETCKDLGWRLTEEINLTLDSHNPISLLKALKP